MRFLTGVTYWPADVGPYLWHDFPAAQVRSDLAAIRTQGFDTVRVLLAWDAFMPTDRAVHPQRLAELGMLLDAAADHEVKVVPVLFAQSIGDSIMLPAYTVDPRAPRPGVRVICDGRVRRGGPRDLYTEPLMRELAARWLEALLAAFAGHPALLAWDLGHDPATAVRPLRFADLPAWAGAMAAEVHAAGDACWLTMGAADLLNARGVRLGPVAEKVDVLGIVALPQTLRLDADPLNVDALLFLSDLAQRFGGGALRALMITTGVAAGADPEPEPAGSETARHARRAVTPAATDPAPAEPSAAAEHALELLARLPRSGAAGLLAWTWAGVGPQVMRAPPFDRFPSLALCGLVDAGGTPTPAGEAWRALAARELATATRAPWDRPLDEEDYYSHLPESALDMFSSWRGVH